MPRVPSIGFASWRSRTISAASRASVSRSSAGVLEPATSASNCSSGRNSCSGGSSSRTVTGSPFISCRIATKSPRWSSPELRRARAWNSRARGLELGRRRARPRRRPGPRRAASARRRRTCPRTSSPRSSPKNMCSVRQSPIPSAPSSRAFAASSAVSALARTPSRRSSIRPAQHLVELVADLGLDQRHVVGGDPAGRALDRDPSPAASSALADPDRPRLEVDLDLGRPGDARPPHPPRDQRRVRRLASLRGEDPAGGVEAGDVVGLGERADEDHVLAVGRAGAPPRPR